MKRYAVLIGINYVNTANQLNGCVNDAYNIQKMLKDKFNYNEFTMLTDGGRDALPTKRNITEAFNHIAKMSRLGYGEFFVHYSGHGTYLRDLNQDETDARDEVIVPLDYRLNGFISDDQINKLLAQLAAGTKCTVIFDSCHSGTVCDLQYRYLHSGRCV